MNVSDSFRGKKWAEKGREAPEEGGREKQGEKRKEDSEPLKSNQCQKCKQTGHWAKVCPENERERGGGEIKERAPFPHL